MLDLLPILWHLLWRILCAVLVAALVVTAGAIYYVLK